MNTHMQTLFFLMLTFSLSFPAYAIDDMSQVRYGTENVGGVNIFYREAGDPSKQAVVLLHGFPSSSHMYRDVLAGLGDEFYLIAPDYPGYGYSDKKAVKEYIYTFDNVAETMNQFLIQRGLNNYVMMIQDFGAPIGFRVATKNPEKVAGFVVMNGNAYEEGLGKEIVEFLKQEPTPENVAKKTKEDFTIRALKWQHTHGTRNPDSINPDSWHHDFAVLSQPGVKELNLEMLYDYKNNIPLYPVWQKYLRDNQPPMLIVWGRNDIIFPESGAAAYKKDVKNINYNILDTGHFPLEEDAPIIIHKMRSFLRDTFASVDLLVKEGAQK